MKRLLLYHTINRTLHPYPRSDDAPVVGLDPVYRVLEVVDAPPPDVVPEGFYSKMEESVDLEAGTLMRRLVCVKHEPTEEEAERTRKDSMAAAFDALPVPVQAAFYQTRVTAETAMDNGRFDIARAIVEAQAVPPEYEAVKAAILDHFQAVQEELKTGRGPKLDALSE